MENRYLPTAAEIRFPPLRISVSNSAEIRPHSRGDRLSPVRRIGSNAGGEIRSANGMEIGSNGVRRKPFGRGGGGGRGALAKSGFSWPFEERRSGGCGDG